ncbi:MAG: ribosomal protein S18-alanine N-acetyltransferase [Eubacteriales bacterium]|nr:ribosomal protein S18-alanine N-acetyltransferase [Eubacteriales bacterium]
MFSIRKMRREDVAEVAELEKKIFPDAWSENAILETWKQRQTMLLIALEDRKIIGYLILYFVLEDGEIARIAVADEYRRKGVAGKMLRELALLCRENGVNRLMLDVRESNEPAKAFYVRQGFEVDGIRKDYYTNPVENAVLMSVPLGG